MKPGEHPEFYTFPAPAGRSRESTIRLDSEGRFFHDGALIEKASMKLAFASWIRRHPEDGRYILSNDYDWTYLTVADVPFFVRGITVHDAADEGSSWIELKLSDGTSERLDPSAVRVSKLGALYTRIKGGEFEARFMPFAQTSLAPVLEENSETHRIQLRLEGKSWSIAEAL